MLEPDAGPAWKRALCMEIVRGLFAEASLIRRLFTVYDAQKGKRSVVKELTSLLTRIATEKPSLIGLSTHSSVPLDQNALRNLSNEQLAAEAGGVAGIIGGAVGIGDATPPGLSSQWSSIRVPCIEQLDKTEAPSTPESYIYGLALSSVNSFSEGLAKFILPIATLSSDVKNSRKRRLKITPHRTTDSDVTSGGETHSGQSPPNTIGRRSSTMKRRPQRIVNPLTLEEHPLLADIQTCASIVDTCWAAILVLYSTYLNATLDNDYYHGLVRSLQKFTQVAGVLDLSTPRDAFLTTLGKAAVPPQVFSLHLAYSGYSDGASSRGGESPSLSSSTLTVPVSESKLLSLNVRNLVCLRVLLNVATALGPTLKAAWTIVLDALQQTDYILQSTYRAATKSSAQSVRSMDSQRSLTDTQSTLSNIGPEITAVEGTSQKLFESTKEFNNEAFRSFLSALCDFLDLDELPSTATDPDSADSKNKRPAMPVLPGSRPSAFSHRRVGSFGNRRKSSSASSIDNTFVISKLGELVQINIGRLIADDPEDSGWKTIQHYLLLASTTRGVESAMRLKASDILHEFVTLAARMIDSEAADVAEIQERILGSLLEELHGLEGGNQNSADANSNTAKAIDADIHESALEALTTMLVESGENLKSGWDILFNIINTAFKQPVGGKVVRPSGKSVRLLRTSFASLQLICTDFLGLLPIDCVLVLIDTLHSFCAQVEDLNISLTVSDVCGRKYHMGD
ncbi:hypothetical protein ABW21_db0206085 [Orbilia brochopaga]|nr:hypothetical protein ABW21_db0206085 [Drechslerella brochopaga]